MSFAKKLGLRNDELKVILENKKSPHDCIGFNNSNYPLLHRSQPLSMVDLKL